MKLFITGICGFVGSTIACALQDQHRGEPLSIFGLDNFSRPGSESNRRELTRRGIKLFYGDLRASSDLEGLPPFDWVIDAAANPSVLAGVDGKTSSRQILDHNLASTVNVLELCKRHKAGFVLLSTSRVYSIPPLAGLPMVEKSGAFTLDTSRFSHEPERLLSPSLSSIQNGGEGARRVGEEALVDQGAKARTSVSGESLPPGVSAEGVNEDFSVAPPVSLYGASKLASEILALEYAETFGFPVWINRCGVLAGAGQFGRADQGIVSFWINSWLRKRPLKYIGFGGHGYQARDVFHPRDLAPLLQKQFAFTGTPSSRTFNFGGGAKNTFSLLQLSRWCAERFGKHQVNADHTPRPFDIPWMVMDARRGKTFWQWEPQTSMHEIFTEIAKHAEANPDWLELSADF
jgi:CDP-paratose 2-epimerase